MSIMIISAEQEILSRYAGWGGVPDAFEPGKPDWADEYAELKSLLTEDEYASAQASVLNSHYTTPIVIRAIWEAIGSMGFKSGNVLDISTLDLIQKQGAERAGNSLQQGISRISWYSWDALFFASRRKSTVIAAVDVPSKKLSFLSIGLLFQSMHTQNNIIIAYDPAVFLLSDIKKR